MDRLTNRKEAEAQQKAYDRRIRQGYPRNIPEERFLRLAAWESLFEDTGLTPDEFPRAVAALCEKQEREKGCEYCRDAVCMKTGTDYHCETTCDKCQYNLRDKKFCSHCGRPLTET
ncbi:hypothetical protein CE91St43_05420 [Oscillospiraceae bacterium]|nr:hypothetical protein CE91St43_05420 [Oscillospiraceae bacterium]